jgi:hypothetical protein
MTLAEEAQRYLAVVEFFRAQGAEPHWRPELPAKAVPFNRPDDIVVHAKQKGA